MSSSKPSSPTITSRPSDVWPTISLVGTATTPAKPASPLSTTTPPGSTKAQAAEAMPSTTALDRLISADQRQLLDTIDSLHNCGLSEELNLPQLVVCGDQSSGKSSVLEALTQLPFPRDTGTCTRFATQISLRQAAKDHITIRIVPHSSRTAAQKTRLEAFTGQIADFAQLTERLGELIDGAKAAMGISAAGTAFSQDVLSIQVFGPGRPQLTVVDLPGIFSNNTTRGARDMVLGITKKFISQPRAICLPVIQAGNDIDNQGIFDLVKKADPAGRRTMGIITKPDRAEHGSTAAPFFVRLARNEDPHYRLGKGWHVLRNRSPDQRGSFEERNAEEKKFFETSYFSSVERSHRGIEALSKRLSKMLFELLQQELPDVRIELRQRLEAKKDELNLLGPERVTPFDCRVYLDAVTKQASDLYGEADGGPYQSQFFRQTDTTPFAQRPPWGVRRFRATIRDSYTNFANDVHERGATWDIRRDTGKGVKSSGGRSPPEDRPMVISPEDMCARVAAEIQSRKGYEMEGDCNPFTVRSIFQQQSARWAQLAEQHIDEVSTNCVKFVRDILGDVCAEDVRERIWTRYLQAAMARRRDAAHDMLRTIVRSLREHPLDYTSTFVACLARVRERGFGDEKLARDALVGGTGPLFGGESASSSPHASQRSPAPAQGSDVEETTYRVLALYEAKVGLFIDNVNSLVVEDNLVRGLREVLTSGWVVRLSDQDLVAFACETDDVQRDRKYLLSLVSKLKDGDRILQSLMPIRTVAHNDARLVQPKVSKLSFVEPAENSDDDPDDDLDDDLDEDLDDDLDDDEL